MQVLTRLFAIYDTMPTKKIKRTTTKTTTTVRTTKSVKVSAAAKKNPLFVSRPKNFRRGGDIQVF